MNIASCSVFWECLTPEMQRFVLLRQKYSSYTDSLLNEVIGGH